MRNKLILVYAVVPLLLVIFVSGVLAAGTIERVSVASDGSQASGEEPSISSDGRYAAFSSRSSNLVPNDNNAQGDIFVRDRQTNTTSRVSIASDGTEGNGVSVYPSISGDGRYVAFRSAATNLVPNDTNGYPDIFVHDRQTNTTTIVSISNNGIQSNYFSHFPSISGDGRYVTFCSGASNLVTNDTNSCNDIFVHDRKTHTTTRISIASNGTQGDAASNWNSISSNGRYVAFYSDATNLVTNDTNNRSDIFVHDLKTHTTTRVSIASDGTEGNGMSSPVPPRISGDGRYVAFCSFASNLIPNDTNSSMDIFVRDRQTNATTRVSIASDGTQGNGASDEPSISNDGRYIAFASGATNLVPNDTNGQYDIFVRDRQTNTTAIVSIAYDGTPANGTSVTRPPSISGNGGYIAFQSSASNLVPNDTNGMDDIFVADNPLYTPPHH